MKAKSAKEKTSKSFPSKTIGSKASAQDDTAQNFGKGKTRPQSNPPKRGRK